MSIVLVTRNDFKTKTLEVENLAVAKNEEGYDAANVDQLMHEVNSIGFKGKSTVIKLKHNFEFFPVSELDKLVLTFSVKCGENVVLTQRPRIIIEYTLERLYNLMGKTVKSINFDIPNSYSTYNHIKNILVWYAHDAAKEGKDSGIFEQLVTFAETKDVEGLTEYISECIGSYRTTSLRGKACVKTALENINVFSQYFQSTLLKSWSNRRLITLGLTYSDIKTSPYRPTELYNILNEKKIYPFAFCKWEPCKYGLKTTFAKTKEVASNLGIDVNKGTHEVFFLLHRELLQKCENNRYMYLDINYLKSLCKDAIKSLSLLTQVDVTLEMIVDELVANYGVIIEDNRFYLHYMKLIEDRTFTAISERIEKNLSTPSGKLAGYMDQIDPKTIDYLTNEQKEAFSMAIKSHISILTGGAGSGKTRTVAAIVKAILASPRNLKVQMTSFTGKAVARMKELCKQNNIEESPRFLEPVTMDRLIHKECNLSFDYLLIDEASMVTEELFSQFVNIYRQYYQILLIGDNNQLKPIGMGELFFMMFKSCAIPIARLTRNFRVQSRGSLLPNIHALTLGAREFQYDEQFVEFPTQKSPNNEDDYKILSKLIVKLKELDLPPEEVKILSFFVDPIDKLNSMFIDIYFGQKVNKNTFVQSQEVIVTSNIYSHSLFNGTCGKVVYVSEEKTGVMFHDRDTVIDFHNGQESGGSEKKKWSDMKSKSLKDEEEQEKEKAKKLYTSSLEHAYCSSIHKSQGSEYNTVILYCQHRKKDPKNFLTINLLYTALSRARECIYIVGDTSMVETAKRNVKFNVLDNLSDRLRKHFKITEKYVEYVESDDEDDDCDDYGDW